MNFLKLDECYVDVYDRIKKHNGDAAFSDLLLNQENAKKVISYLQNVGIKPIYELLIYEIDIFNTNVNVLRDCFEKNGVSYVVNLVNNDYFTIEEFVN